MPFLTFKSEIAKTFKNKKLLNRAYKIIYKRIMIMINTVQSIYWMRSGKLVMIRMIFFL